ncbi:unnamed protein product, partial [Nesidiocoris tenuis]
MGVKEDIVHFLACCPVLNEVRRKWFGAGALTEEECLQILRAPDLRDVTKICSAAWRYSSSMMDAISGSCAVCPACLDAKSKRKRSTSSFGSS